MQCSNREVKVKPVAYLRVLQLQRTFQLQMYEDTWYSCKTGDNTKKMDCAVQVQHTGQRSAGHKDAETAKEHITRQSATEWNRQPAYFRIQEFRRVWMHLWITLPLSTRPTVQAKVVKEAVRVMFDSGVLSYLCTDIREI